MVDINKIFDDLSSEGNGIQKEENKLYKELIEFEKTLKNSSLEDCKYIEFLPVETEIKSFEKSAHKLAADSTGSVSELSSIKSKFLLSKDGKYAIKYSQKSKDEIIVTLMSDSGMDTGDMLLYLPDLKKYYVSNSYGDFHISGYSSLNIQSLNFQAVNYFEKIIINKLENSFAVLSYYGYCSPEIVSNNESFLKIKLNCSKDFAISVLSNELTQDFIGSSKGILDVPSLLLDKKSTILLY